MEVAFALPVMQRYASSRFVLHHNELVAHVCVVCVDAKSSKFGNPSSAPQDQQAALCPNLSVLVIGVTVLGPKHDHLDDFANLEAQC